MEGLTRLREEKSILWVFKKERGSGKANYKGCDKDTNLSFMEEGDRPSSKSPRENRAK